jgi:TonB family protein
MMSAKTWFMAFLLAALFVTMSATAHAEDASVTAARELYASAAYDDALKMLDGLVSGSLSVDERRTISLYRALCLVALGRGTDADRVFESLVEQNPLYRPAMEDLPPRMRSTFTETRRRLMPGIIQRLYADAKAAFDREDFRRAADGFTQAIEMLGDPDVAQAASQPPLSDLKVVANGFHDLAMKELELPPLSPPAPVLSAAIEPVQAPSRNYNRLYSSDDPDVAHPGIIRQTFPTFPGKITTPSAGVIEVIINASGEVESAAVRESVHPQYDHLALSAAKRWRFTPATIDGIPVKFLKRVQVTLAPGSN